DHRVPLLRRRLQEVLAAKTDAGVVAEVAPGTGDGVLVQVHPVGEAVLHRQEPRPDPLAAADVEDPLARPDELGGELVVQDAEQGPAGAVVVPVGKVSAEHDAPVAHPLLHVQPAVLLMPLTHRTTSALLYTPTAIRKWAIGVKPVCTTSSFRPKRKTLWK